MIKYVIRLGKDLYVATRFYGLYQATVRGPENAYKFSTYEDALKVQKKTLNGKIEEYVEEDINSSHNENMELREIIKRQQEQINELKKTIEDKEISNGQ